MDGKQTTAASATGSMLVGTLAALGANYLATKTGYVIDPNVLAGLGAALASAFHWGTHKA